MNTHHGFKCNDSLILKTTHSYRFHYLNSADFKWDLTVVENHRKLSTHNIQEWISSKYYILMVSINSSEMDMLSPKWIPFELGINVVPEVRISHFLCLSVGLLLMFFIAPDRLSSCFSLFSWWRGTSWEERRTWVQLELQRRCPPGEGLKNKEWNNDDVTHRQSSQQISHLSFSELSWCDTLMTFV